MKRFFSIYWLPAILSAVFAHLNFCRIDFFFSWVCYIPLFISIFYRSPKQTFKSGFIFGFALSVLGLFWIIPGAERFTGYSVFYGIGVFLISTLFISVYTGMLLYCFSLIKNRDNSWHTIVLNGILIAALFTVFESLLSIVSDGFPWFDIHSGHGLVGNIYSIQPASLLGIHFLTFVSVLVNYLFAGVFLKKLWVRIYVPVTVIVLYMIVGFFMLKSFENKSNDNKSFDVAIMAENIPPEMKWDNNTGNYLVGKLLDMSHSMVSLKPNIALWSESAIPWTYRKDDDLVNKILSITAPAGVTHILGMNTELSDSVIFNSAYCILPNGEVTGRYDKQYLLSLIEKPLSGIAVPFFSSGGFYVAEDMQHAAPLNTPYGKAGILICNEASIPKAAANMVMKGAEFLFNMSNDGWFSDTYITPLHFYCVRLRAVESRKDIVVNSNNGYSGLIKASGDIVLREKREDSFVKVVSVQPNKVLTLASDFPNLFVYICAGLIALIVLFNFVNLKKLKVRQ